MPIPGVDVTLLDTPGAISTDSDSGTAFVTGLSDRGPVVPVLIQSLAQFVEEFGARVSYSGLYDWIDVFFREGGSKVYVSRVVGPSPTSGSHNLVDNVAAISLVATALGPGAWSANYKVAVVAGTGSNFQIQVLDSTNVVLEQSGDLADQQSAVNWAKNSEFIRITLGASALNPVVAAAAALSSGTDDRANITDTQWLNSQNLFTSDLGPGQVAQPGRTTSTAFQQLIAHADANNRVAILDLVDTATSATLKSAISTLNDRFSAAFAGWLQVPGVPQSAAYRVVPPSALICGLCARNDPTVGPNQPSAGRFGISRYATGLSSSQSGWNYTDLNTSGVNVIRFVKGAFRVYGWRSLTDPINDPSWIDFGNSRLYIAVSADLENVGEEYLFDEIDGQNGSTIGSFHDELAGVLMGYYNSNQFFGDTAEEAFAVDTGPQVNTLQTIAALELHAVCYVKMSPFAEHVAIEIVKRQVTESIV